MRHHLRPSAIWISLAAVIAVIGVALFGQEATTKSANATPSETPAATVAAAADPVATSPSVADPADVARAERAPEETPPKPTTETASVGPLIPAGEAGMLISIDPETGRPGKPSAELRAQLETLLPDPALDRSMEGIEIVHKPDGSMMADLKGRFADYTIIRLTPDGRKIESCVQGPQVEGALRHSHDTEPEPPAPKHEVR